MRWASLALVLSVLTVSGCVTPAQIAQQREQERQQAVAQERTAAAQRTALAKAQAEEMWSSCLNYGNKPGTPGMAQCLAIMEQGQRNRDQAQINAILAGQRASQAPAAELPRYPTTTNCVTTFGITNCTSR